MEYAQTISRVVRTTVRNPFVVLLVSVTWSASLLPFVTGILLAGTFGALVGLWTTSLLIGFVVVGGARLVTVVLERQVSLGTEYFWEGLRDGKTLGLVVGVGTFLFSALAFLLFLNPLAGIPGMVLALFGVYVIIIWYVLVTFTLTLWARYEEPVPIRSVFSDGAALALKEPVAAGWVVVQTVGWALLSIPLIIAPVLVLPGFAQMICTAIVRETLNDSEA